MLGLQHNPLSGVATSLRDHGILDRPERRAAFQVYGDSAAIAYAGYYFDSAYSQGVAAVEAVVGRVVRHFTTARIVAAGRMALAPRLLTVPVLAMIARNLMERGESLHLLDVGPGRAELYPADRGWYVGGGLSPTSWIINATVTGANASMEVEKPRAAWLHIVRDPSPNDPSRGVPALQRANVTALAAQATEDALRREGIQPSAAIVPMPDLGEGGESIANDLRARLENPNMTLAFPPTTQSGWGGGAISSPQTDWKPFRLKSEPTADAVKAAGEIQARVVAALGAHPAILGGAGSTGTVDREARRQLMESLVMPLGELVAYEASMTLGEEVRFEWPPNPDTMLVEARAEKIRVEIERLKREPMSQPGEGG